MDPPRLSVDNQIEIVDKPKQPATESGLQMGLPDLVHCRPRHRFDDLAQPRQRLLGRTVERQRLDPMSGVLSQRTDTVGTVRTGGQLNHGGRRRQVSGHHPVTIAP